MRQAPNMITTPTSIMITPADKFCEISSSSALDTADIVRYSAAKLTHALVGK